MAEFGFNLFYVCVFVSLFLFFLFFFSLPLFLTFPPVYCTLFINSCTVHKKISREMHTSGSHLLFTDPQTSFFNNFFIKNGSHDTIHIFKNYFATVYSVSVFSFSKNKLNPNGPLVIYYYNKIHKNIEYLLYYVYML